jgi:uncharacterized protein
MRSVRIINQRTGTVLAERADWYASPWRRFRGLMLRRSLPEEQGIVLVPCNSVHMALMRFPIDVLFLDRENCATKVVHGLRPYRVAFGARRTHAAVELPAGTLQQRGVQVGDSIAFEPRSVPADRGIGA